MNDIWSGLPWSKKEIMANFYAIIALMMTATIMLLFKSWILTVIYWLLWLFYFIIGPVPGASSVPPHSILASGAKFGTGIKQRALNST